MLRYRVLISLFACATVFKHGFERFSVGEPKPGEHVWLHGASNGELASARLVLDRLIAQRPELNWLVTCNTVTAREMVESWALPRVSVQLAPVDLGWLTRRVYQKWRVSSHISLEAEIWPNRVLACPGPVILLGARMSEGTASGWKKLGRLASQVMGRIALASAQDAQSAERLKDLGLSVDALESVCDLKSFYREPDVENVPGLRRETHWLAASTHEGDEAFVLAAHKLARLRDPELRLVLAPRHPRRAAEIRAMIEAAGFSVAQRSLGEEPGECDAYLADTMGEMAKWYAGCGRVFVGGTLSDRGGHTPYEPAAFGAALLHGPDTRNFRAAFAQLDGIACKVATPEDLASGLTALSDPAEQIARGQAAQEALRPRTSLDELCSAVLKML